MTNHTHHGTADGRPSFEEVLAEHLLAVEAGAAPDREAFIRLHPQCEAELRAFFADESHVHRLAGAGAGLAGPGATAASVGLLEAAGEATGATPRVSLPPRLRYFGEYELLREQGRGGMGVVYRARHTRLNRVVALKMILAGALAGPDDV